MRKGKKKGVHSEWRVQCTQKDNNTEIGHIRTTLALRVILWSRILTTSHKPIRNPRL